MSKRLLAHITDTHLGQTVQLVGGANKGKMSYRLDNINKNKDNLSIVLEHVKKNKFDEVVYGGDIGVKTPHEYFFTALNTTGIEFRIVLGNHDTLDDVRNYCKYDSICPIGTMDYAYKKEYFKYIFLDTACNEIMEDQLNWLKVELVDEKRIILFLHHPIIEIETIFDKLVPLKNRERIREILIASGCEVNIFCGHYHMNDIAVMGNLKQFSTPAVSYQVNKDYSNLGVDCSVFGYRRIEIQDTIINTEIIMFNKI